MNEVIFGVGDLLDLLQGFVDENLLDELKNKTRWVSAVWAQMTSAKWIITLVTHPLSLNLSLIELFPDPHYKWTLSLKLESGFYFTPIESLQKILNWYRQEQSARKTYISWHGFAGDEQ